MIRSNIKFSIRNMRLNMMFSVINVIGLTIGISACLLIFCIVNYELSFDRFQPDRDRIYRAYTESLGVLSVVNCGVPTAIFSKIKEGFSGVETLTNFHTFNATVNVPTQGNEPKDFGEHDRIIFTRPDYFSVFNYYKWLIGNPEISLSQPFQGVLTVSRAKIYFGNARPSDIIGREIYYSDSLHVTVSGIVEDVEQTTDLDFTEFISLSTIEQSWLKHRFQPDSWSSVSSSSQLFIKLIPNVSRSNIQGQLSTLGEIYKKRHKNEWNYSIQLQKLSDLHFNSSIGIFDHSRLGPEKNTLYVLLGIAGLILILALANFINLATAQNSKRAKEVGLRKVLGGSGREILAQFLIQSLIVTILSIIISMGIVPLVLHNFTEFIPSGIEYNLSNPIINIFLVCLTLSVVLLGGLYPGLVLSSYKPILVLKNLGTTSSVHSKFIRNGLTILQFSFVQILTFAALVVGIQVNFMIGKDLGFSSDAIVYFYTPIKDNLAKTVLLKSELQTIPEIEMIALGSPPCSQGPTATMEFISGSEIKLHQVEQKAGDTAYLRLYNIKIIAGRNFIHSDTVKEYLINETYLHELGFNDPLEVLGKSLDRKYPIVGVVKDFHSQGLQAMVAPEVIYNGMSKCIGIKLNSSGEELNSITSILKKLEIAWRKIHPATKFEYWFLSDTVKESYGGELRIQRLINSAASIALIVACLGLYGFVSFSTIQRTKEIGIRKVMGSSVINIVMLISWDLLKPVLVAVVVSAPVAYYFMGGWLNNFAYRINLDVRIYLFASLISCVISLFTICFQTIKVATTSPVESLRYE